MSARNITVLGALIADETRAEILCALMDGRAHTGSELARHVGVAASTASEHLSKLFDAGIICVEPQGRHRYWRLATPEIAALLETLGAHSQTPVPQGPRVPAALAHARTCYDHLAGDLAVAIYDALVHDGHLIEHDDHLELAATGIELFAAIGADTATITAVKRPRARRCLDWTQRRHHLAGASGKAMLDTFFANDWARRGRLPRSILITGVGRLAIRNEFSLPTSAEQQPTNPKSSQSLWR